MSPVAALYVAPRGPYPGLLCDHWDERRDARTYVGPHPIVAHPPCGPWGALRHLYEGNEHDCAPRAVEQVRALGGILEHPKGSKLWGALGLPEPSDPNEGVPSSDAYGGYSIEVDQVEWGHVARKRTWLYLVRVPREAITPPPYPGRQPTHWTSGGRTSSSRKGSPVPNGIKVCSAQQRRRTPRAFAIWLLELASKVREPRDWDPTVKTRLREPEHAQAVLAWAVAGCLEYQRSGLGTCAAVEASTAEYRAENDHFGEFLADCCTFEDGARITRKALRTLYEEWAAEVGRKALLGSREVAAKLRSAAEARGVGFDDGGKVAGERAWTGVRRREPGDSRTDKDTTHREVVK